jgi:hypothetical protein
MTDLPVSPQDEEGEKEFKELARRYSRPSAARRNNSYAPPRYYYVQENADVVRPSSIPPPNHLIPVPSITERSTSARIEDPHFIAYLNRPDKVSPETTTEPSCIETTVHSIPINTNNTIPLRARSRQVHTIVPTIVSVSGQSPNKPSGLFTAMSTEGKTILNVPDRHHSISSSPERQHHVENDDEKKTKPKDTSYYTSQEFMDHLEMVKIQVYEEFKLHGPFMQFRRDAKLWKLTIEEPEVPHLGTILRRIFTTLRYGGFLYREHEKTPLNTDPNGPDPTRWMWWHDSAIPIASAMSHGSRVIIQLPKKQSKHHVELDDDGYGIDDYYDKDDEKDQHCHAFWRWLITGNPKGDVSKYVSTATNGNEARRTGRFLFKRLGATHALQYQHPYELQQNTPPTTKKKIKSDGQYGSLPGNRRKVLLETKTVGITFRDTKVFRGDDHVLRHHRHWGLNLPVGGAGYLSLTGRSIESNGEHGHMYIYYMAPKVDRYGGIMIGVEGSEYGKHDQGGGYHGLSARSPLFSPTFGYKWRGKHKHGEAEENRKPDLGTIGPCKYNGMLVDLTGSGWTFLMEKEKEWNNDYIFETSCPVPDLEEPRYRTPPTSPLPGSWDNVRIMPLATFMGYDDQSTTTTTTETDLDSSRDTTYSGTSVPDFANALQIDTKIHSTTPPDIPSPTDQGVKSYQVQDMMSFIESNLDGLL